MEDLRLSFVNIRLKHIDSQRVLRLVATLSNAHISESDVASFEDWFRRFYRYVDDTNTRFCVVYAFDTTIDNVDAITRMCTLLGAVRDVTRRLSVTTCVVAPSLLSMVAQMALSAYSTQGHVHFVDTLREAKNICREACDASRFVPKKNFHVH